jgi:CRISPR-associated protein Csh1
LNLPQLTARIGQLAKEQMHLTSDLAVLVKTVNLKDEDKPYRIFLTFDLEQEEIRFDEPFPYQSGDEYQYHYFGNNSAAGMQYYLTRDGKSLHYLLKSALSDLYLVLEKHQMQQGELHTILSELAAKKLIYLGANKGKGSVNLSKMAHVSNLKIDEKNNFIVDVVSRKAEDFLMLD